MIDIKVKVLRYSSDTDSTLGIVYVNDEFFCYSLEDEYREKKVMHETRIPSGIYTLGIQDVLTPMTKRYKSRYPWFEKHLHVKNVEGFTGIYIHVGNDDDDTSGCLLLGDTANNNRFSRGKITSSTQAYKRFYSLVYAAAKNGKATIEYIDYN